ncbi:MAG: ABC transporter ATP-binding protein [Litorimonas sp.]
MIVTRNLRKTYLLGGQEIHALDGVDLTVPSGQFLAVVGASGSGKSTLMNMLGGLDKPDTGEVEIDGQNIVKLGLRGLARFRNETLGFVFQSFQLLPRQTALGNVMLPLTYRRPAVTNAKEAAQAALGEVDLADRMLNKPTQLSGGQQQRVAIARALVGKPKLLLADEPTGALDSKTSDSIMALLKRLSAEGLTIILITHDADVAAYADRIVTMRDGRVVEDKMNEKVAA